MRNTYGVKGLMEWECQIRNGKTLLHVTFTGGTQTEYGVTPAKYSTDNPVIQRIIEKRLLQAWAHNAVGRREECGGQDGKPADEAA